MQSRRPVRPDAQMATDFVAGLFASDMHAMRVLSVSNAVVGLLFAASLSIHAMGRGLAAVTGKLDRHGVKQIDRLLSNTGFDVWKLFALWVPHVIGERPRVYVNLDWTDFDGDGQTSLVASIQTDHGRSTPLLWLTVPKAGLKGKRNEYEDRLLVRLAEVLPSTTQCTIVADRGFGDHKLYELLTRLGLGYIIRFRSGILVTSREGETKRAADWLRGARPRVLRDARVTAHAYAVPTVIVVQKKGMKDAWCLVASDPKATGKELIKRYGKRFTIEEMFRDQKNGRFGMGLNWTRIANPARRDRLLMIAALAQVLLEALGRAGEACGLDRTLKTNTAPRRQLSLFRQGVLWYERIPMMPEERLQTLMAEFNRIVLEIPVVAHALGLK